MQKPMGRITAALAAITLLVLALPGCGTVPQGSAEWEGRTLVGIDYGEINGMTWGDDFEISLSEHAVVYVRQYARLWHRYRTRENLPLSPARWQRIGEAVIAVMPALEEVPPAPHDTETPFATDAGSSSASSVVGSGLWLTWRAPDGSAERIRYYVPSDERFDALRSLLVKAAR
ncbi:MAG: hypothetical protein II836_06850 [Clostridia bacterium]|nr:hypothetical protein [Clostridia bacterium]